MAVVVGLTFAFLAIVALAWPVLRRRRSHATKQAPPDAIQEALRRRDRVYDDIKTLILDHELGNVPADEYAQKLAAFRIDAARAIRDLEQVRQAGAEEDDDLEKEVLELRRSWGSVKDTLFCQVCVREVDAAARLCPRCEMPLGGGNGEPGDAQSEERAL